MQNATASGIEHNTVLRWLPDEVQLYLKHTEEGASIRSLARDMGVHASTVLRQVQKTEARRDDPLVDALLTRLGEGVRDGQTNLDANEGLPEPTDDAVSPHLLRLLRAMIRDKAVMVVSQGVDTAVVLSANEAGEPITLAKGPTEVVEVMALQGWIEGSTTARICRYHITSDGRLALNKILARQENQATGFAEAPTGFTGIPDGARFAGAAGATKKHRRSSRPVGVESPVRVLGRSKGKAKPYLAPDLVIAAERLHRDFALGQFELSGAATWDRVQEAIQGGAPYCNASDRKMDARKRLADAMTAVGPELGQIAIAVCCHERGMERIEADMSMPARSGKYMLRVALNYLARHYKTVAGDDHELIY